MDRLIDVPVNDALTLEVHETAQGFSPRSWKEGGKVIHGKMVTSQLPDPVEEIRARRFGSVDEAVAAAVADLQRRVPHIRI